jgi:hypothetical protein
MIIYKVSTEILYTVWTLCKTNTCVKNVYTKNIYKYYDVYCTGWQTYKQNTLIRRVGEVIFTILYAHTHTHTHTHTPNSEMCV